jgi:hypothetical protein
MFTYRPGLFPKLLMGRFSSVWFLQYDVVGVMVWLCQSRPRLQSGCHSTVMALLVTTHCVVRLLCYIYIAFAICLHAIACSCAIGVDKGTYSVAYGPFTLLEE